MAEARTASDHRTMNTATKDRLRRQVEVSDRWGEDTNSGQLLGHCKRLLMEAEDMETAGSAWRSGGLNPAVLDCFGTALNSLATVALLLDQAQNGQPPQRDESVPDPSRLLSAVNQNLRFAAEAAGLAGEVLSEDASRLP
jgi:hypothetical protein